MEQVAQIVARAVAETRPWSRGIVTAVDGEGTAQRAAVMLDGAAVATPGIPLARDLIVEESDYVLVARLAPRDLVILAKLPA